MIDREHAAHWRHIPPESTYGGGPGLDAYHLDALGWIPESRILTLGSDGVLTRTVTVAPLNHPERSGYLLVRVPFDPKDPFHYFTVADAKRIVDRVEKTF